jgi:hypothetical protein
MEWGRRVGGKARERELKEDTQKNQTKSTPKNARKRLGWDWEVSKKKRVLWRSLVLLLLY